MDTPSEEPPLDWLTLLLQVSDALFPTGAYAHSLGFEEAVRLGLVRDERSLGQFLHAHLTPALVQLEMPFVRFAREAAASGDWEEVARLDTELGAAKLAREAREASAHLGVRRFKGLRVILPENAALAACERAMRDGGMAGHHAVVCGVQAAVAGIPLEAALRAYFYQSFAATGGAALKLIRIGQDAVQRVLRQASAETPAAVARSLEVARDEAGWFNPLLEIAAMRHERAAERLFIS